MGRRGDEGHVAVMVAMGFVVAFDGQQASVLALRARVGLQAHGIKAGYFAEPGLQVGENLLVTFGLLAGGEGVQAADFGPGHRNHLGSGVQLHGARTERNHAVCQAQVLVFELLHVAQYLVLGVVAVEHRVREVLAGAHQIGWHA